MRKKWIVLTSKRRILSNHQTNWEQNRLEDVRRYSIWKFQKIVACEELVLYIFGSNKDTLFAFFDNEIKTFKRQEFEAILPVVAQLDDITFIKKSAFDTDRCRMPSNLGPCGDISHPSREQDYGALLIPCPGNCKCDHRNRGSSI